MNDLPILIVGPTDEPWEWLDCDDLLDTVRIDGPLPTVNPIPDSWVDDSWKRAQARPLRAGDRVALKSPNGLFEPVPFATATVARVKYTRESDHLCESGWLVTVTDVEALS